MGRALTTGATAGDRNLAAVRSWRRLQHSPPSVAKRLEAAYTSALALAVVGALAYGVASSALAQVVTPDGLARLGPALALIALIAATQWGAYQGPVVFSVPDVVHLLGAPLPRAGLSARRLVRSLGLGAVTGGVLAALLIVGLAGQGRGIAGERAAGLTLGVADLGVLGVAAAWAVERSGGWERVSRRVAWPAVFAAAALAGASGADPLGRRFAPWSGPWGWSVLPGVGADRREYLAGVALLTVVSAAAALAAVRDVGHCPTERHMGRAEGRASAVASLVSFDARSAWQGLEAVGPRMSGRRPADLRWMRLAARARGPRITSGIAAPWRDAVAAARFPGRVVEASILTAGGTSLALLDVDRPLVVAAGMLLVYLGASRMLTGLRSEIDVLSRARVLQRPRPGAILRQHLAVPVAATALASAIPAAGCAVARPGTSHAVGAALLAVAVTPGVTCCAAMAAKRGGRLPQSVLAAAMGSDPSGGGAVLAAWLSWWPSVATALATAAIFSAAKASPGGIALAVASTAIAAAALLWLIGGDPADADLTHRA